jgi:hypothetical protein
MNVWGFRGDLACLMAGKVSELHCQANVSREGEIVRGHESKYRRNQEINWK